MKCNYEVDDIIRLLDNETDAELTEMLTSHIKECGKCQEAYEALKNTQKYLSSQQKCTIDINSKIKDRIDLNRYSANKMKRLYLTNYHYLKTAALFVMAVSLIGVLLININPIAYNISNGIDRIKEAFIDSEDSNAEMKLVVSKYDYIKFQYPKKWEIQSETSQDGTRAFNFYLDKERGIYFRLYKQKTPITFDDKGFKSREIQMKNGSAVKFLTREKDGYTEFKCLINNYYAVDGTLVNSLYNENKALIIRVIESIELLDSNYNRIPVEKEDTQLSFNTYITKPTEGRTGPDNEYESIETLSYGKLVRITGSRDTETGRWYLAEGLPNFSAEKTVDQNTLIQQNFWIPMDAIDISTRDTISFDYTFNPSLVSEYKYIVRNNGINDIELKQLPDEKATGACVVRPYNLLAVVKTDGEWSLVKKFHSNTMESISDIGWIKNSDYMAYSLSMSSVRPNQGFLIKPFNMYSQPGVKGDIPERIIKNPITPVNVIKYEGGYVYVSSGFNGVAFYVEESVLRFALTPEQIYAATNTPDKIKLTSEIQEDILNWGEIKLHELDYLDTYITLTKEQRVTLAGKLTGITKAEQFDGGVSPVREAEYPFYTLEFVDTKKSDYQKDSRYRPSYARYSLVYSGENRFTVNLGDHQLPNYAIPVKFITVNKEFSEYIKTLLPAKENTDVKSFNYLLNAKKVKVFYNAGTSGEKEASFDGKIPQQINKCVRTVLDSIDTGSANNTADENAKYVGNMEFYYDDGSMMKIELTDKYVKYNGTYYKYKDSLLKDGWTPQRILISLFAAYF